ncbi:MAG: DNA polymerase III subunit beta [Prevotella sp.]|nr:DNA polymerase III subunit beta [Prevotella sp.]MDY5685474.1 DNA polymerase III subunit beta [Prevotella sp.]
MRFTLSSSVLNGQLLTLSRVINSKNSLPILDCFLFEVNNGQLTLTASDKENVMTAVIPLDQCDGDGCFALPNKTILDAVKELPEQPLTFDIDTDTLGLKIIYQNGMYQFVAQSGAEFPKAQAMSDGAMTVMMGASVLVDNITRSLFATAQDELRPVMNGVFFDITDECMSVVATDGHKLVRNRNFLVKSETPTSFILPKKPAGLLKVMLAKSADDVVAKFDSNMAMFATADATLTCRLIEGRYPNYNSVIPKDNPNELTIDRKSLIGALRRVLPFASESNQLVRLHLETGKLVLTSEDIDFSTSAKETMTCDYSGKPMDIGFKGSSLSEILTNLDSEEVTVKLADPSRAGVIVPTQGHDNEDVLMLIMPMLLND